MLLSIDLLGEKLVEVDLCVAFGAHSLLVQVVLQIILEAHHHVQAVSLEDLEDKKMGTVVSVAHCEGATEDSI